MKEARKKKVRRRKKGEERKKKKVRKNREGILPVVIFLPHTFQSCSICISSLSFSLIFFFSLLPSFSFFFSLLPSFSFFFSYFLSISPSSRSIFSSRECSAVSVTCYLNPSTDTTRQEIEKRGEKNGKEKKEKQERKRSKKERSGRKSE